MSLADTCTSESGSETAKLKLSGFKKKMRHDMLANLAKQRNKGIVSSSEDEIGIAKSFTSFFKRNDSNKKSKEIFEGVEFAYNNSAHESDVIEMFCSNLSKSDKNGFYDREIDIQAVYKKIHTRKDGQNIYPAPRAKVMRQQVKDMKKSKI